MSIIKLCNLSMDSSVFDLQVQLMFNNLYFFIIFVQQSMESVTIQLPQEMRVKYFPSRSMQEYKGQNDYLSYLISKGAALNPKLFPSVFHLKNGLPYIGMAVKQTVIGGQVLMRIPEELILSSAKALRESSLEQVFKDSFFTKDENKWQDKVLIVYSLFLLQQKDESNPWFQMVRRFPKQCDIACFWSEAQLDEFKDKTIKSAAKVELDSFEAQWSQFQSIKTKYKILQGGEYSKDNYRTIHIHFTNRSFGKYLNYTSFVPIAQLFNHHCSKVFYTVQNQLSKVFIQQNLEQKAQSSSIGSYKSNQYLYQGEFDYDQAWNAPVREQIKAPVNLLQLQRQQVMAEVDRLINQIQTGLKWQDFSVIFAGHLFYLTKFITSQYLQGNKSYQTMLSELKTIQNTLQSYKNKIQMYSVKVNKKPYWNAKQQQKNKQPFQYPIYQKQYQSLVIKTSSTDKTEPNNQIYFRYGRTSNRELLMVYGFAIQGNKYQNFKLSFNISQIIGDYPAVMQQVVEKKLSLERKFKLYNHRLNIDLIIFFRLSNWTYYGEKAVDEIFYVINVEKQIAILQQIISILQQNVQLYEGDYDLTDKSLNYHQYFIRVYHKQKLSILKKQIKLFGLIVDILQKICEGVSKQEATKQLTTSQKVVLKQYLQMIV